MRIIKYLLEIKNRLILLFIAWLSTVLIAYFYKETLLFIIIQPFTILNRTEFTHIFYFIFTDIAEILHAYLNLILFLSFQVLCIYTTYHFFLFLSPAFFYSEYLFWKFGIQVMVIMWGISIVLSSYLLIPITWQFFLSFQNSHLNLHFEAKLKEYLSFYISSYFLYQLYFQLFTFFLIFFYITNFNKTKLKKSRKFNYYCFIILSTLCSPPETISQICGILTIIFIYEFTLFILLVKTHC